MEGDFSLWISPASFHCSPLINYNSTRETIKKHYAIDGKKRRSRTVGIDIQFAMPLLRNTRGMGSEVEANEGSRRARESNVVQLTRVAEDSGGFRGVW